MFGTFLDEMLQLDAMNKNTGFFVVESEKIVDKARGREGKWRLASRITRK